MQTNKLVSIIADNVLAVMNMRAEYNHLFSESDPTKKKSIWKYLFFRKPSLPGFLKRREDFIDTNSRLNLVIWNSHGCQFSVLVNDRRMKVFWWRREKGKIFFCLAWEKRLYLIDIVQRYCDMCVARDVALNPLKILLIYL